MLDTKNLIPLLIRDKYAEIKKFSKDSSVLDIYDLTPHPIRYTTLKYTLKIISLPFTVLIQTAKFFTLGALDLKYFNIGKIFLNKMNEGISKKILHGLPEKTEDDQTISKIIGYILKKYEEQVKFIEQPKLSLISKIIQAIPGGKKLMNFWDHGGIKYSGEVTQKKELINFIYKRIVCAAYNAGKKGAKLEIADIKTCFPEIKFEEKITTIKSKEIAANNQPVVCKLPNEKCSDISIMMVKALYDQMQVMVAVKHYT